MNTKIFVIAAAILVSFIAMATFAIAISPNGEITAPANALRSTNPGVGGPSGDCKYCCASICP